MKRLRGLRSSNRTADQAMIAPPIDDAILNGVPSTHGGIMFPPLLGMADVAVTGSQAWCTAFPQGPS